MSTFTRGVALDSANSGLVKKFSRTRVAKGSKQFLKSTGLPLYAKITSVPWLGHPWRALLQVSLSTLHLMGLTLRVLLQRNTYALRWHRHLHLRQNFGVVLRYYQNLGASVEQMPYQPKISILLPVYRVKIEFLKEAIDSVLAQVYDNWEICAVDDASQVPEIKALLESYQTRLGPRMKLKFHDKNQHISACSNSCLALATGEYVALLDHDDRLYPNALAELVRYINLHRDVEIFFSDERHIDADGEVTQMDPFFKPDFSPQLHLSVNYTTHLSLYRTDLLRKINGFRLGFEGSQDHDLMLRAVENTVAKVIHVPFCLYQWRAHGESTAGSQSAKPYAALAGEKAVSEALIRRQRPAKVSWEEKTLHYRVQYHLPNPAPLISIIIPTRDRFELISRCLNSVLTKTDYPNFELIILDHLTADQRCLDLFAQLAAQDPNKVKIYQVSGPFNFARFNNIGSQKARGDYLVLLNNDTEVISTHWLQELLGLAQWPEIGAVGAKLLFENGTVQHGGMLFYGRRIAGHMGAERASDDPMYYNLLNTVHEVSGVTAACLMIAKDKYLAVGGLDELWVPNGWGDVHFAAKLLDAGFTNVYTPYAELYHYESPSRGMSLEYFEHFFLQERFGQHLLHDKYLNLNLLRQPDLAPDHLYMGFEIYREGFRYFLNTPKDQWSVESFLHGLNL